MRNQSSAKNRTASIAAICAAIAVTACGGQAVSGGTGAGSVASLPASSATGSQQSSGADSTAGGQSGQSGPTGLTGVTMPDNATPAERNRIQDAWATCMEAHGDHHFVDKPSGPGGFLTTDATMTQIASEFPAAIKACASLQPHPPWQQMPQYNPDYQRDYARWINCMNRSGVPVTAVPGGFDYDGTSSLSQAQQQKVTVQCEMQAFDEN